VESILKAPLNNVGHTYNDTLPALAAAFKWQQLPAVGVIFSNFLQCISINKMHSLVKERPQKSTRPSSLDDRMKSKHKV
jgi:hypothetical protein